MKNIFLKNTLALIVGLSTVFILSGLTDVALIKVGFYPNDNNPASFTGTMLIVSLLYRLPYQIIGCFLAGILSTKPMFYSMLLGTIGALIATVGTIVNWNMTSTDTMHYFCIALIFLAFPTAWIGGKLSSIFKK